ncbi:citramalate synthase [Diaminobutyricibacter tongyongensis]|uniref:Citramalate synthase n=1 Tax=Leifsonia tongyongensis TaxID=1268043 RepID=A0A6L9XTI8_9MICO|nr:citramalate synthase [Diaminobutyricibacter tongyongensis]NEN04709.1 citramalate synthase [Diaminobutyricibacter tongyongensis]
MSSDRYPRVRIVEEGMREGMQIESASISSADKIALLDALSRTGLETIVVGSFVSPAWTPQMAHVDEVVAGFTPVDGVTYTALALNQRGRERMRDFMPPLSLPSDAPRTLVHLCDVFVRRNSNRSQADEIAEWPRIVERAVAEGETTAGIGINAAWGSNWLGRFDEDYRMDMLERQMRLWTDAGIIVDRVWIGDPMAWNLPDRVESQLLAIKERWPQITTFHLHLHDARGVALASAYQAIRCLGPDDTLVIDTSVGGMGGCPYGGHGRMTRMIPTEDFVDLLCELGIPCPVDQDAIIEASLLAEKVVGHELWGHLSRVGARPRGDRLYPVDMPFVETKEQAEHFRRGPAAYEGARSPWKSPVTSPVRDAVENGQDPSQAAHDFATTVVQTGIRCLT